MTFAVIMLKIKRKVISKVSSKFKTLALGQVKESTLFKKLNELVVYKIVSEYFKKKTGKLPEKADTFSGLILHTEFGKFFFKDGEFDFEPSPFHVKKVKNWNDEIKAILRTYVGRLYVLEVKKFIETNYKLLNEQDLGAKGVLLEVETGNQHVFNILVTPKGQVVVLSSNNVDEKAEASAGEIIKALESAGLVDF